MQRHQEELYLDTEVQEENKELEFETTTLKTTLIMQRQQKGLKVQIQSCHAEIMPHSIIYEKNHYELQFRLPR